MDPQPIEARGARATSRNARRVATRVAALCVLAVAPAGAQEDSNPLRTGGDAEGPGPLVLVGTSGGVEELAPERLGGFRLELLATGPARTTRDTNGVTLRLSAERTGAVVDDPVLAREAEQAGFVLLRAGSTPDWYGVLHRSLLMRGLLHAHRQGAPWLAGGRAASFCSAWALVEPDEWDAGIERNPRKTGRPTIWPGLGLFPWGLVETEDRGSLARMLDALFEDRVDLGVHLPASAVLVVDTRQGLARGGGNTPSLWIDLRGARRLGRAVRGGHLSLIHAGDVWEQRERDVRFAGDSAPLRAGDPPPSRESRSTLDRATLEAALVRLAGQEPPGEIMLRGERLVLTLRPTARARVARRGADRLPGLARVELDLERAVSDPESAEPDRN